MARGFPSNLFFRKKATMSQESFRHVPNLHIRYQRRAAAEVICLLESAISALIALPPVVTSSPRTGFALMQIRLSIELLQRVYGPLMPGGQKVMPPQGALLCDVAFAQECINDGIMALVPFTEPACLVRVKQHLERAFQILEEGLREGEFDDDFNAGLDTQNW